MYPYVTVELLGWGAPTPFSMLLSTTKAWTTFFIDRLKFWGIFQVVKCWLPCSHDCQVRKNHWISLTFRNQHLTFVWLGCLNSPVSTFCVSSAFKHLWFICWCYCWCYRTSTNHCRRSLIYYYENPGKASMYPILLKCAKLDVTCWLAQDTWYCSRYMLMEIECDVIKFLQWQSQREEAGFCGWRIDFRTSNF